MQFPEISENQPCMSPDLFIMSMKQIRGVFVTSKNNRYERVLEPELTVEKITHDLRNPITVQDFGLEWLFWSLPLHAFIIWMSWWAWGNTDEDMDPILRSWLHKHTTRTTAWRESLKGSSLPAHNLVTSVLSEDESDQSEDPPVQVKWETDREGPSWKPSFTPAAARADWDQAVGGSTSTSL